MYGRVVGIYSIKHEMKTYQITVEVQDILDYRSETKPYRNTVIQFRRILYQNALDLKVLSNEN
jgi:hypothetical protein